MKDKTLGAYNVADLREDLLPLIKPAWALFSPNSGASTGSSVTKAENAVMLSTSAQQIVAMRRTAGVFTCIQSALRHCRTVSPRT